MMEGVSVEALRAYLECPVCLEVPRRPPILQCVRGHLICPECASLLTECPMCRCSLSNPKRLLLAERLLEERIPVPCRYEEEGCKVELIGIEMKKHEAICVMAPRPCHNHLRGCTRRLSVKELQKHASECPFRLITCPLVSKCYSNKPMMAIELERHLKIEHFNNNQLHNYSRKMAFTLLVVMSLGLNIWLLFHRTKQQSDLQETSRDEL